MKTKALSCLVGVSTPLILTGTASAGFTGISTVSKPNEFGLFVVNVYAEFDNPGNDHMVAVGGTPLNQLTISVIGGTFFQHMFGQDRPPLANLVQAFPDLAFDTFVTIGVKKRGEPGGQPEDNLILTCTWPGFGDAELRLTMDGWVTNPNDAQGDPFNPDFVAGDGRTLIGQFATADGIGFQGTMFVQYVSDGEPGSQIISWTSIPSPGALALLGTAGLLGVRRRRR